jgi:hypothetical protein
VVVVVGEGLQLELGLVVGIARIVVVVVVVVGEGLQLELGLVVGIARIVVVVVVVEEGLQLELGLVVGIRTIVVLGHPLVALVLALLEEVLGMALVLALLVQVVGMARVVGLEEELVPGLGRVVRRPFPVRVVGRVVEVELELRSQLVVIVELGKVVGLGSQLVAVVPVLVVGMELERVSPQLGVVVVVGMELELGSLQQLGAVVVEEVVVGSIAGRIVGNRLARQLERRMELGSTRLGLGPMEPR